MSAFLPMEIARCVPEFSGMIFNGLQARCSIRTAVGDARYYCGKTDEGLLIGLLSEKEVEKTCETENIIFRR